MSLPSRLGVTDLSKFFSPYLKVPQSQNDSPSTARHCTPGRRRIGFAWRGNPQHKNDHRRSLPIMEFAQHLPLQGADWVSLQVGGDVAGELNRLRTHLKTITVSNPPSPEGEAGHLPTIEDAGRRLEDFLDTARAITATDHVITVDTAVAHLAGALGHATTLLLPNPPDCRWGLRSRKNPWYPATLLMTII